MDNIVLKDQDITTVRLSVWEQLRKQVEDQQTKLFQVEQDKATDKKIKEFYVQLLNIVMSQSTMNVDSMLNKKIEEIRKSGFNCEHVNGVGFIITPKDQFQKYIDLHK